MTHLPDLRATLRLPAAGPPDAERLGWRMAALYRGWDERGVDLAGLVLCLLGPLGVATQPVGQACLAVAAAVAAWRGHPYHSARHHAEVATNAAVLAEVAGAAGTPVPPRQHGLLLAAAFAHDYLYEPGGERFTAETRSAAAMGAIAATCGMLPEERADLHCLILATEPGFRRVLSGGLPCPGLPEELAGLLARPDLVGLAALLSDADLLSSAGLSMAWHRVQHGRLERELGRRITADENLTFLQQVVGPGFLSAGGRFFDGNLERIRRACKHMAGAPIQEADDDR